MFFYIEVYLSYRPQDVEADESYGERMFKRVKEKFIILPMRELSL